MHIFYRKLAARFQFTLFLILSFHLGWGATPSQKTIFQGNWKWTDDQQEIVNFSKWKGKPIIIGMAYTSCRMYCPLTIRQLKKVFIEVQKEKTKIPEIVFVTIDPRRDTPEKLSHYKAKWDLPEAKNWHFLSGTPADTQSLAQFLGIHFREIDEHFEHDNKIIILNENGEITKTLEGWDSVSPNSILKDNLR